MKRRLAIVLLVLATAGAGLLVYRHVRPTPRVALPGLCLPHQVPAARCPWCHPNLIAELGPCVEHGGIPEAFCALCTPALVPGFKAAGDWCVEHATPESQCGLCNPALLPVTTPLPPAATILLPGPPPPRTLQAPTATCTKTQSRILFKSPELAAAIGLEYHAVGRQPVSETVTAPAEITYDASLRAVVAAPLGAVVRAMQVRLGDDVVAGEAVATLAVPELAAAQAAVQRWQAALAIARERAERAAANLERQQQLDLRMAAVSYLRSRELLAVATARHDRAAALLAQGAIGEPEALSARAAQTEAQAELATAERALLLYRVAPADLAALTWERIDGLSGTSLASDQEWLELRLAVSTAEHELAAARLVLAGYGLDAERHSAEQEQSAPGTVVLRAPRDGRIVARHANEGELVERGAPLLEVADTSRMWAMLALPAATGARLAPGLPVTVTLGGGERHGGRLTWIGTELDRRTRLLPARVELANAARTLRDGLYGRAEVTLSDRELQVALPRAALQWEGCCNVVFIRRADQLFEPRQVRLGYDAGEFLTVAEGLAEGDVVVTTGSFLLKTELLKGSIGAGCCEVIGERN